MYIQSIEIENIRSLKNFKLTLNSEKYAGWHVLLGENGSGKSTVLQAVALALVGEKNAEALRLNWEDWLKRGKDNGAIKIKLIGGDLKFHHTTHVYAGSDDESSEDRKELFKILQHKAEGIVDVSIELLRVKLKPPFISIEQDITKNYANDVYSGWGWFSAAYGPFRRFTGGNSENDTLFKNYRKLAAHLSVFG
jgi:AAA15 family ATPase/GTPase